MGDFGKQLIAAAKNLDNLSAIEIHALLLRAAARAENREAANIALRDWCARSGLLGD